MWLGTEPRLRLQGAGGGKTLAKNSNIYFLAQRTQMRNCVFSLRPKSSFIHCASP